MLAGNGDDTVDGQRFCGVEIDIRQHLDGVSAFGFVSGCNRFCQGLVLNASLYDLCHRRSRSVLQGDILVIGICTVLDQRCIVSVRGIVVVRCNGNTLIGVITCLIFSDSISCASCALDQSSASVPLIGVVQVFGIHVADGCGQGDGLTLHGCGGAGRNGNYGSCYCPGSSQLLAACQNDIGINILDQCAVFHEPTVEEVARMLIVADRNIFNYIGNILSLRCGCTFKGID